jgi:hypothetical protein
MSRKIDTGLNLNDLYKLAKKDPKYTNLYAGLFQIDRQIKNMVSDTIVNLVDDPDMYYSKTLLLNQCYNLYLYNVERQATVGVSWTMADFLLKCENKTIQDDIRDKVTRMVRKFGEANIESGEKINWVY